MGGQAPTLDEVNKATGASFLSEVDAELMRIVVGDGIVYRARAGEVLIDQDDTHVSAIVVDGLVRVFLRFPDGRGQTVRDVTPGSAVGVAALAGLPNPVSVQAILDSHLLQIDPMKLIRIALNSAPLAMAVAREVTRRLHDTYAVIASDAGSLRQRVARRLLDIAAESRGESSLARVNHGDLAIRLGCSRESVTRTFARLRRQGLITTSRHGVRILDPVALQEVANSWLPLVMNAP